jgi:aminopeptidase N
MARLDPHSHADDSQPKVVSLDWWARVDFGLRTIEATATLQLGEPAAGGALDLDSRGLAIDSVSDDRGSAVPFELGAEDAILGRRLTLTLAEGTKAVTVRYRTSPEASALQWLEPAQTAGGKQPYLFSQCQAIHARSVVPLQDTPSRRITFTASLSVPAALRGLMAAGFVGREVTGDTAVERWSMTQPIAPYLFALAVGEVESRELGPRSRVWAEPSVVDAAAWEFEGIDALLTAGERLFGPYAWDRFDVLVMPPSFPFGGMENPRLTFVTPTLLAGDRSQVRVIAHELAHAWTGNLVTNANAEHFWLNEGWTRYAELRITEAVEGADVAALLLAICRKDLEEAIGRFVGEGRSELTKLRTQLSGVDPDDAFSTVPYDKGNLFLMTIEAAIGRPRFDAFLKRYLERFRFGALTTEEFSSFTEEELPGVLARIDAGRWLDEAGLPENAPVTDSARLRAVVALGYALPEAGQLTSSTEWNLWLERVPRPSDAAFCAALDERFALTKNGNMEVKVAWLRLAITSSYDAVLPEVERVLGTVGRMKYLIPLYTALHARSDTAPLAVRIFEHAARGYHPIARAVVQARLGIAARPAQG